MNKFALIVESGEVRSQYNDAVITKDGDKFLVVIDTEGWVEATSSWWDGSLKSSGGLPLNLKLFESFDAATEFAKRWGGHPWYRKPNGNFEVIEVRPVFQQVQVGYDFAAMKEPTK
jgi:hypothetical protein